MRNVGTTGKRIGHGWWYNWYAVMDSQGLAPKGWDIPTDEEWKEMEIHLGMSESEANRSNTGPGDINLRGTNEGGKLKSTITDWLSPNEASTNEANFNALPSGLVDNSSTQGWNMGDRAVFWCKEPSRWIRRLMHYSGGISRYDLVIETYGFSIRCIQPRRAKYGRLYTWACAAHSNIAPIEWRAASENDFLELESYIDTNYNTGANEFGVGNHLKSRRQVGTPLGRPWSFDIHPRYDYTPFTNRYGRNTVNFKGIAGGSRSENGEFGSIGDNSHFWTSTPDPGAPGSHGRIFTLLRQAIYVSFHQAPKTSGRAIRCVRDATVEEQGFNDGTFCDTVIDVDGNGYDTVKIDDKVWMVQNLITTKLNDGTPINNVQGVSDWNDLTNTDLAYCDHNNNETNSIEEDGYSGTLKDIDGNIYKWVVIGDYRWMAENLRTTRYRNGIIIPEVTDNTEWSNLTTGARCAYNNDHYFINPAKR